MIRGKQCHLFSGMCRNLIQYPLNQQSQLTLLYVCPTQGFLVFSFRPLEEQNIFTITEISNLF